MGHIYTSIYYCCKSLPVPLHDVMVGGWIASYVFIFIFWSRCCCCCCCVLLLLPTSVLKRREVPPTVSSFSVSATTTAVSFASILLLLLLLRRDMHFYFLVEVLVLLIIFLVGCAAAGACAAYNISTEAERGRGYCFFLLRFCRLHCDASDVYCCCCSWLLPFLSFRLRYSRYDVDCAAVETCLLYTSPSPRDKRQSRMPSSA